jgi:glycosyltransferase involved in cell wall biosynthesis
MIPISFVFITRNAGKHIGGAIKSISKYANEILILDQESTDSTRQEAISALQEYTKINDSATASCAFRPVEFLGICEYYRQPSIEACRNNWVFVLDADERLPEEVDFDSIISDAEKTNKRVIGFPRTNVVIDYEGVTLDSWLGNEMQYRLLDKRYCYWPVFIHSSPVPIQTAYQERTDFKITHLTELDHWPKKGEVYNESPTLWGKDRLKGYHLYCYQRAKIAVAQELLALGKFENHRQRLEPLELPENVWLPPYLPR